MSAASAKLTKLVQRPYLGDDKIEKARRDIFEGAKVSGRVTMLDGGGAKPLELLVATANGWLVCVKLNHAKAKALGELILQSVPHA
jgi:hypothetical protein